MIISSKNIANFIRAIALVLVTINAFSQHEPGKLIRKFSIQEGLSQAVVNSISQDKKGFMWFATDDGFNRFDGYTFQTFKFDCHDTRLLHDNFVQRIFNDSEGNLWVSSRQGMYNFDLSTQELFPYLDSTDKNRNDVSYITESSGKKLWVAWYWGGFASFDKDTKHYTAYNNTNLTSLTSTASITLHEDNYGLLWIGTQDKGLNVFEVTGSRVIKKRDDLSLNDVLPSLYVKCIQEDHFGNIWIGTTGGLVVYLRKENRFRLMPGFTSKPVFSLREDSDRTLWVGTRGDGLYTIDLKDYEGYRLDKLKSNSIGVLDKYDISRHTILSIFEDKDKNIWLGTSGDGIFMIGNEERKFMTIQTKFFLSSAERYLSYHGLCNDADGNIWAGTDGEGIFKFNTKGEILKQYSARDKTSGLATDVFISAYRDHNDNLWFGSYSDGLYFYDRRRDAFIHYTHAPTDSIVPLGNQIRLIREDSRGNIWIGATRGGVCLADKATKNIRQQGGSPMLKTVDARAMVEDNTGALWIGCYGNGLASYRPDTHEWKTYFEGTGPNNPLNSTVIYALALDNKNRLWIGTGGGGLSVLNLTDKKLKRYSEKEGLLNNTVYGLVVDDGGNIWISTIKGLSKLDPEKEQFFNYTSADGLQQGQFYPGSALYDRAQEYIAFGGTQGVNLFNPMKLAVQRQPPKVIISGLRLFNNAVTVGRGNADDFFLNKVIDEVGTITLNHDQSVLTFEFTGINYLYPEKINYKYKFEGFDQEWNHSSSLRATTYKYLPPGDYEFKVKATFQDNPWPDQYASVRVIISPPFWRTWTAYFTYFSMAALLTYVTYSIWRRQEFLRKRLRIEKKQRKHERQLVQEKLSFFTEVSHEFRTPLTLMIGPLEELLTREGSTTPVGKKLKMVYKNAFKLLNLINKLLDYRKVENGNLLLKVKENNIVDFAEEVFLSFTELAQRKKIQYDFYAEEHTIQTWFDKEKMEMVLSNLLSNSFKYIGHGTSISVCVRRKAEDNETAKVVIEIKDNGIGIRKEDLKYIFDWFYKGDSNHPLSTGIGLSLAKKLVHLHKGQIQVNSTPGSGSVFTIKLPLGSEHFGPEEIITDQLHEHVLTVPNLHLMGDHDDDAGNAHKKGLRRILIVEDDDEVRSFLKEYFEPEYKVIESVDGKHGLHAANEHIPDLVISDVMMPEMDGIELCRQLKNDIKTSHIPVILLTANTSFTHQREGLEFGADHYITKPFSPEMLNLTINNLLHSRENLKRFYLNTFITNGGGRDKEDTIAISPDEQLLHKIHEILKANLDNANFNLDQVCDQLNMSRSLMYKKIKALTGLSPIELVRSIKLTEAANLLRTQKYKVFEVVYMVGFSDLKYFRECFIRQFGYPPSQLIEK